jgi:SAM-dependent methyltransferase
MKTNAKVFNDNFQLYDDVRPGYPEELYNDIENLISINSDTNVLEIGAGNGIATLEIYNKWHLKIDAIEPGNELCGIMHKRFNGNDNISILNDTFENITTNKKYDIIISATAFHWLDLNSKYKQCHNILKENGCLIIYWNNYGIENDEIGNMIQEIYNKNSEIKFTDNKTASEMQMKKIESRKNELENSKYFKLVFHKIYKRIINYSTDDYIKLLHTYSDHTKYDDNFFDDIRKIINENGGKIGVRVLTNLEIGKKKW